MFFLYFGFALNRVPKYVIKIIGFLFSISNDLIYYLYIITLSGGDWLERKKIIGLRAVPYIDKFTIPVKS